MILINATLKQNQLSDGDLTGVSLVENNEEVTETLLHFNSTGLDVFRSKSERKVHS